MDLIERFELPLSQRPVSALSLGDDEQKSLTIRPRQFSDYPGQDRVKENLMIYVKAAKARGQPLDHVLLHGPPGLGKTTLSKIIAYELEVPFYEASGPTIEKAGDLAGLLAGIEPHAVVFVDEVHRIQIAVEEILYGAMEDYCIDIIVGQGGTARSVKMPVPPFTFVGATTRMSLLSAPLRSRFGIMERLEFYDPESLAQILRRSAEIWQVPLSDAGALELARRSRGTPRIANRLLRRARDYGEHRGESAITEDVVQWTLERLEIDESGLDRMDRRILQTIRDHYKGGPVGIEALAATIGEEKRTIEDVYEPYLLHCGFLIRGPRGRELADLGVEHLQKSRFEV